jgi:hypothetical protein
MTAEKGDHRSREQVVMITIMIIILIMIELRLLLPRAIPLAQGCTSTVNFVVYRG